MGKSRTTRPRFTSTYSVLGRTLLRWFQDLGDEERFPVSTLSPHWSGRSSHLERAKKRVVYAHHGASVIELKKRGIRVSRPRKYGLEHAYLSTIVGCREERDELPLCKELVTVFHDLLLRDTCLVRIVRTARTQERPLTWCARQIKSISCFAKKRDTTSLPNVKLLAGKNLL